MNRFQSSNIELGQSLSLDAAAPRQAELDRTLEQVERTRLKKAEVVAAELLQRARTQADEILSAAQDEAKTLLQLAQQKHNDTLSAAQAEGHTAGFQAGFAEGFSQAVTETQEARTAIETLMRSAYKAKAHALEQQTPDVLALIQALCQQIFQQQLIQNPEALRPLIAHAVAQCQLQGNITLRIHPKHAQALAALPAESPLIIDGIAHLTWETDPLLNENDLFVVAHESGFQIDPFTQLQHLLEAIAPVLPNGLADALNEPDNTTRHCKEQSDVAISSGAVNSGEIPFL